MTENIRSNIKVIENQNALSAAQKVQFKQIIAQGLKGKFNNSMRDDEDIYTIIDLWVKYGFLPMDETFCAVDCDTDEVLSIILLNNFKEPSLPKVLRCAFKGIFMVGLKKTIKLATSFYKLDAYNKTVEDPNIIAEVYLVATREDLRGTGIGTILLDHALKYLHTKCQCKKDICTCQIKILVFADNPAKRLYERFGFKEIKCVDTPDIKEAFGSDYNALVWMQKEL